MNYILRDFACPYIFTNKELRDILATLIGNHSAEIDQQILLANPINYLGNLSH